MTRFLLGQACSYTTKDEYIAASAALLFVSNGTLKQHAPTMLIGCMCSLAFTKHEAIGRLCQLALDCFLGQVVNQVSGSHVQRGISAHANHQLTLSPRIAKRDTFELQITQIAIDGLLG